MIDTSVTKEMRDIAHSMIACSEYGNLPDWKLDSFLKEIIAEAQKDRQDVCPECSWKEGYFVDSKGEICITCQGTGKRRLEPEFNNALEAEAHNWDTRELKDPEWREEIADLVSVAHTNYHLNYLKKYQAVSIGDDKKIRFIYQITDQILALFDNQKQDQVQFNPDYLDFDAGVEAGRVLEREKILTWLDGKAVKGSPGMDGEPLWISIRLDKGDLLKLHIDERQKQIYERSLMGG